MLINFFSRFIILIYLIGIGNLLIAQTPKDFSLDLCASTSLHTLDTTRTIVTIKWSSAATTPLATGYRYKTKSAVLWNSITLLTAADTSFIDTIPTSSEREYQVLVDTSGVVNDYIKYGNILVGRKIPATLQHGRLLVLIDSAYLNVLDTAIEQYRFDLIGDGFIPVFKYVNRTTSVTTI